MHWETLPESLTLTGSRLFSMRLSPQRRVQRDLGGFRGLAG
jgi:hypothetical protein